VRRVGHRTQGKDPQRNIGIFYLGRRRTRAPTGGSLYPLLQLPT
jgi:hypothetical protein